MDNKVVIKKVSNKKTCLRKRKSSSSDEDSTEKGTFSSVIEEIQGIQKLRERQRGVEINELGIDKEPVRIKDDSDPFKVKTGGMVNMKNTYVKEVDDAYDVGIGTQFSAETNKRDEDEEMMKYIEEQLEKKKMQQKGGSNEEDGTERSKYHSPEEAALQALPDHLRQSSGQRSEEMLSNQMLSGIPEVELGIEYKIKNIEATEEAKIRLIWEQRNKKEGPSQFVPTNITVNFTQPAKLNAVEEVKKNAGEKRPNSGNPSEGTTKTDRATDDFHYERFKKQFRRF